MRNKGVRRTALFILSATTGLTTAGCAMHQGPTPTAHDDSAMDVATLCQAANRDMRILAAYPELRRACSPWHDPQTSVLGL